jgi:glycogen operon protein
LTWINWEAQDTDLLAFTQYLISLRHQLRPFANQWYSGVADAEGNYDLSWWNADGTALQGDAWHQPMQRTMGCLIGKPGRSRSPLLLLINSSSSPETFALPRGQWQALLDTSHPRGLAVWRAAGTTPVPIVAHSVLLLQQTTLRQFQRN